MSIERLFIDTVFIQALLGLTDCISFIVMQEQGLTNAVTADRDFVQAGYRALMLES